MKQSTELFNFESNAIQVMLDDKNQPWFIASEVCKILEISNSRQTMATIPEKNKLMYTLDTSGQKRSVALVNEPGLYRIVAKSRKAEAVRFQDWIFEEVLPTIRKTGSYGDPFAQLQTAEGIAGLLKLAQKKIELEKKIEIDKPKVELHDKLMASKSCITMKEMANLIGTGRTILFKWLRDNRMLMEGQYHNQPYQRNITRGFFETIEHVLENGYIRIQTVVTSKGQSFILKAWNDRKQLKLEGN